MDYHEQPLAQKLKTRLIVLAIGSALNLTFAVALAFVLTLEGFSGLTSSSPIQLNTCSVSYYSNKYSQSSVTTIIPLNYAATFVSLALQVVICIAVYPPLIKRQQPSERRLSATILLTFLQALSAMLTFGKSLTFEIDFRFFSSNCSVSYSQVLLNSILAVSASLYLCSLLQIFFILWAHKNFVEEIQRVEKYQVMVAPTNNTLENMLMLDEKGRTMSYQKERMPIETPTVSKAFQSFIPKNKDEVKEGSAYERKQTFLGEDSKNQMKHQSQPKRKNEVVHKVFEFSTESKNQFPTEKFLSLQKSRGVGFIIPEHESRFPQLDQRSRSGSNFQEQSLQSLMKQRKQTINLQAIQSGPINKVTKKDLNQIDRETKGYLNFVRRMNVRQGPIIQTEEELIASIKGKYSKP